MNDSITPGMHLTGTFRSLRHRNYRLLFFIQMAVFVGTWMQTIAQQWLVYRLTGLAATIGIINLLAVLPLVPLVLWGGSLADRFPKRHIMLVTQSTAVALAFILSLLTWMDVVQVWHIFLLAMALGAVSAVDTPTRHAFVVEMVEDQEDLTNAIALNSALFNLARVIGPVFAGMIVAMVGETSAFFINGLVLSLAVICLLMINLPAGARNPHQVRLGSHVWEAMRYMVAQPVTLVLLSVVTVSAFLSMPYVVLLPVFAKNVLSDSAQPLLELVCYGPNAWFNCQSPDALTYGLLMAATGVGAVLGALFVASLPGSAPRGRWLTAGNISFSVLLIGMAFSYSFAFTLVLLLAIGFSFVIQNTLANTLIQVTVPNELRGRVMSFYTLTVFGMMRAGGMQAGLMGDYLGAPIAVGIGAFLCLIYGLFIAWRYPAVRIMH
jgi:MFS family permease